MVHLKLYECPLPCHAGDETAGVLLNNEKYNFGET